MRWVRAREICEGEGEAKIVPEMAAVRRPGPTKVVKEGSWPAPGWDVRVGLRGEGERTSAGDEGDFGVIWFLAVDNCLIVREGGKRGQEEAYSYSQHPKQQPGSPTAPPPTQPSPAPPHH